MHICLAAVQVAPVRPLRQRLQPQELLADLKLVPEVLGLSRVLSQLSLAELPELLVELLRQQEWQADPRLEEQAVAAEHIAPRSLEWPEPLAVSLAVAVAAALHPITASRLALAVLAFPARSISSPIANL